MGWKTYNGIMREYLRTTRLKDIHLGRLLLEIALIVSLVFNYILWADQKHSEFQMRLMKQNFVEDVVGYDYCGGE